jgi:hypothetical protein
MEIQTALDIADAHANDNPMTDEVWALRVLAGCYRREKQFRNNKKTTKKKEMVYPVVNGVPQFFHGREA